MDHHCPWINNCVGMYNMKFFLLFLLYVSVVCLFAFVTTLMSFVVGLDFPETIPFVLSTLGGVVVLLFSTLFGVFCLIMFCDILTTIRSGQTSMID